MAVDRVEDIKDSESLEEWLATKEAHSQIQICNFLAYRNALRILPLLRYPSVAEPSDRRDILLSAFRVCVCLRVASTTDGFFQSAAARFAKRALDEFGHQSQDFELVNTLQLMAMLSTRTQPDQIVKATCFAISRVPVAVFNATLSPEASGSVWTAIASDARSIENGESPSSAMLTPLWPPGQGSWWRYELDAFTNLFATRSFQAEHWNIWLEWFTTVTDGGLAFNLAGGHSHNIERRIALGGERTDFWDREPGVINAEIAGWVEKARNAVDPDNTGETWAQTLPPQQSTLMRASASGGMGSIYGFSTTGLPPLPIRAELDRQKKEARELEPDLSQRPSGHVFDFENGKIVAKAVFGLGADQSISKDVRVALIQKARDAAEMLLHSQSPERFQISLTAFAEFLETVKDEQPELGKLLMLGQSVEADMFALLLPNMRKRFQEDVIAHLQDVQSSLELYYSLFSQIMKIQTQRLALKLATNDAGAVATELNILAADIAKSDVVGPSSITAINQTQEEIETLSVAIAMSNSEAEVSSAIEARANLVGQRLVVVRNFIARNLKLLGTRTAKSAGKGYDSAVEEISNKAVKAGVAKLIALAAGPLIGIAAVVFMFAPFAKRAEEVKKKVESGDEFDV